VCKLQAGCYPLPIPHYKVYIVAIAAKHVQLDSVFLGRNSLTPFILRPFLLPSVYSWEISVVLEGLSGPAFEPLESVLL